MKYYFCGDLWPFLVKVIIWWPRKINCIIQKRTFGQIISSDIFLISGSLNYSATQIMNMRDLSRLIIDACMKLLSKYAFLYFSSFLNQAKYFETLYFTSDVISSRSDLIMPEWPSERNRYRSIIFNLFLILLLKIRILTELYFWGPCMYIHRRNHHHVV